MSTNKKCPNATLARLLGWSLVEDKRGPEYWYWQNSQGYRELLPQWTADDAAAFRLMVEHDVYPYANGPTTIHFPSVFAGATGVKVLIENHDSRIEAVRYGAVLSVILKLQGERNGS